MAKLFDERMVETTRLMSVTINFNPTGYGNPTKWKVLLSASFLCLDPSANVIGTIQSGTNTKIPYYTISEDLDVMPSKTDIIDAFFSQKTQFDTWVNNQTSNLTGIAPK